jgi:hypothetical protein
MTTEREDFRPEVVRDLLLLVGVSVPIEIVVSQTPHDRVMAGRWAAAGHLRASDNDDVAEQPEPAWVRLFKILDADPDPVATAVGRWEGHVARVQDGQRHTGANEVITLELAFGAVMAQQLVIARMKERIGAALETADPRSRRLPPRGASSPEWVIETMTRELLGSDEAYEEFRARFGDGNGEEDTAP